MHIFNESKTEKGNEGGSQKRYEKCEATMERESAKYGVEHLYNDQENENTCDGRGAREHAICVTGVGKNVKKQGEKSKNPLNSEHYMLGEEGGGKGYAMESVGVAEKKRRDEIMIYSMWATCISSTNKNRQNRMAKTCD